MKLKLAIAALSLLTAYGLAFASAEPAAANYKAKCMSCHGADGMGATPAGKSMKAVPFNSPEIAKASDETLIASTTNGKGKMPAYSGKLTAPEIKDLVTYIRTLK